MGKQAVEFCVFYSEVKQFTHHMIRNSNVSMTHNEEGRVLIVPCVFKSYFATLFSQTSERSEICGI